MPASKCASDLSIEKNDLLEIMLNGGDDYEILFTSNPKNIEKILSLSKSLDVKVTKIGKIEKGEGVDVFDHNLNKLDLVPGGYEHR